MGLFDIFLPKDKRDDRARERLMKRAVDKYAQSADRSKALESLAADGSDEALYGLLKRFGLMYDKSIEDEQEKEWVFDTLVAKGDKVLGAVKRYLLHAESVSWPLRILDRVASKDVEIQILEEVLGKHEPGYERDPSKKMQLLAHLGQVDHARSPELVAPYLKDMDEGVRYTAAESLVRLGNAEVAVRPLCELFASPEEESFRLRLRIAEGFSEKGWTVPEDLRAGVNAKLPDAFALDKQGQFKKK